MNGEWIRFGVTAALLLVAMLSFSAAEISVKHLRQFMQNMRSENNINKRITLFDFFGGMFLLHHAAAKQNLQFRFGFLNNFQRADITVESVFGMFPDGAGVE